MMMKSILCDPLVNQKMQRFQSPSLSYGKRESKEREKRRACIGQRILRRRGAGDYVSVIRIPRVVTLNRGPSMISLSLRSFYPPHAVRLISK